VALGTWVGYLFVLDILVALILGLVGSLHAFGKRRRRYGRRPSRRDLLIQAHTTFYSLLSLVATVLIVAYLIAEGVKEAFQLEQDWANQQWLPIRMLLLLLVGYVFFGVIFFISQQTADSFVPMVKRWAEQLEDAWRAYRSGKPVTDEEALLRYSFSTEWP
jgi:sterol desaturase/sphingolipid hydroxylase (fatty acid hydroxylase superfamily)